MADVTISNLPDLALSSNTYVPISNGSTTGKALTSGLGGIPSGFIGLWSGAANAIPNGWFLCDGNNGTPNLVDRFVLGAGTTTPAVGAVGGSKDAIVVSHTHPFSTDTAGAHSHSYSYVQGNQNNGGACGANKGCSGVGGNTGSAGAHSHSGTTGSTGSSGTNANLPPYYALCYIMKV